MKSCELALAVEDETVIRKERSGYNSLEFSSRPTWRARTGRVRSRIQSRRSAGAFFADFHPASASPSLVTSLARFNLSGDPGRVSLAPSPSRYGSLPESMTKFAAIPPPSTIHGSGDRSYFNAMFAISKQSEPVSTSARRSGANSGPDGASSAACLSCRACLMSQKFRAFYRRRCGALSATGFEHAVAF